MDQVHDSHQMMRSTFANVHNGCVRLQRESKSRQIMCHAIHTCHFPPIDEKHVRKYTMVVCDFKRESKSLQIMFHPIRTCHGCQNRGSQFTPIDEKHVCKHTQWLRATSKGEQVLTDHVTCHGCQNRGRQFTPIDQKQVAKCTQCLCDFTGRASPCRSCAMPYKYATDVRTEATSLHTMTTNLTYTCKHNPTYMSPESSSTIP